MNKQEAIKEIKTLDDKCGIICQHGVSYWWPTSKDLIKKVRLNRFEFRCNCEAEPKEEFDAWAESKEKGPTTEELEEEPSTIEEEPGDLRE